MCIHSAVILCSFCIAGLIFLRLVVSGSEVHLTVKERKCSSGVKKMNMFTKFAALIDAVSTANRYGHLFSMTDAELAARGLSREG